MSYDTYVVTHQGTVDVGNYTFNMRGYFQWALGSEDGLKCLNNIPAKEAVPLLKGALEKTLKIDGAELDRFNATNGWGDWESALLYLQDILRACEPNQVGGIVRVII